MSQINVPLEYDGHPKVVRLTGLLGKGSAYLPIKLWLYAGKYHADSGRMTGHSTQEVEAAIGWWGREGECVKALMHVDLLRQQDDGFEVMGLEGNWLDLNGHLSRLKERAQKANEVRWGGLGTPKPQGKDSPQEPSQPSAVVKPWPSKPAVDPLLGMPYTSDYLAFVKAFPHERGKKPGQTFWSMLAPDAALRAKIMAALEQHKRLKAWQDPQFVPNIDKWLSENRWEMDLRGQEFVLPPSSTVIPKCGRRTCAIKQHKQKPSPLDGVTVCDQCWDVEQVQAEEKRFP